MVSPGSCTLSFRDVLDKADEWASLLPQCSQLCACGIKFGEAYRLCQTSQADEMLEAALHWGHWAILAPLLSYAKWLLAMALSWTVGWKATPCTFTSCPKNHLLNCLQMYQTPTREDHTLWEQECKNKNKTSWEIKWTLLKGRRCLWNHEDHGTHWFAVHRVRDRYRVQRNTPVCRKRVCGFPPDASRTQQSLSQKHLLLTEQSTD